MELAVNMFTGGMVLDSHPLVQSSDTLSDALNATYITMNGNEVVLLNDMGNRRVDNAYLPAGYEPIGIKEHGGIIYIAAYNPITHRSQIGSFPSPERNMGTEYEDNGTEFNFSNFVRNNYLTVNGIKFLKDDILLFPLTKDTSLHAGDKFTVYSDYIWNYSHLITNFGVKDGNIIKYARNPFNSYFTLSLGVMNSLNEFSDITSSLERFDSAGNIIKGLESNEDKFNTGYFIAPNNWKNNPNNGLTNNDTTLLENRGKIGANTYAYKLTGPLYLKVELNHILTFSYSINMSKVMTSQDTFNLNLYITGTAVYNCPDSGETDESAYFDSFKLLMKKFSVPHGPYDITVQGNIIIKEPRIYDSTTGLYTSSITKLFIFLGLNLEDFNPNVTNNYFLNYLIAVPIFHPTGNNIIDPNLDEQIYLSNLSESGSIDISKIGTNDCELGMWRFKNNIEDGKITSTLLDYRFDCYADLVTVFRYLTITLCNQTSTLEDILLNNFVTIPDEVTSGRLSIAINWDVIEEKYRINFLDLYIAKIKYNKYNKSTLESEDIVIYRFILGTKLFNQCYEESDPLDFGVFMGEIGEIGDSGYYYLFRYNDPSNGGNIIRKITPVTEEGNTLRKKYLTVDLDLETNPSITIKPHPTIKSTNLGKPIYTLDSSETNGVIEIIPEATVYKEVYKTDPRLVTINCPTEWKLSDKNLYPKNTFLLNLETNLIFDNSSIEKKFEAEEESSYDLVQYIKLFKKDIITILDIEVLNNKCTFSLILKDKVNTTFEQLTRTIGKAYFNLNSYDALYRTRIYNIMSRNQVYCNLRLLVKDNLDAGYDDYYNTTAPYGPSDNSLNNNFYGVYSGQELSIWGIWFRNAHNYWTSVNINTGDEWGYWKDMFKNMGCPFTFGFTVDSTNSSLKDNYYTEGLYIPNWNEDRVYRVPINNNLNEGFYSSLYYTRVWWADEDGNPCLLNNYNKGLSLNPFLIPGLFYADWPLIEDSIRIKTVYDGILKFLGEPSEQYRLVVPIEDIQYEALYPTMDSYIYFENLKINLTTNILYNLITNSNSGISNSSNCLLFLLPSSLSKTKETSTTIKPDNSFSQSIILMMLSTNLSSFSIDLELGIVLSDNDPLKHLYVRSSENPLKLKTVPVDYPLQINEGVKTAFPIVCKKKYSSNLDPIGNCFSVIVKPGPWGMMGHWVPEGLLGVRVYFLLDAHSQSIPILFQNDLINPLTNIFN